MIFATLDIETSGLNRYKDDINWIGVGLAHSIEEREFYQEYYFDFHEEAEVAKFIRLMKWLLEKKAIFCWQNGKFDTLFIELKAGITLPIHWDTMLMGTIYDLSGSHKLKDMAMEKLKVANWDISTKEKTSRSREKVVPYLSKDVLYTWWLIIWFKKRMTEAHIKQYKLILRPGYLMYRDVERKGLALNQKLLRKAKVDFGLEEKRKLATLKKLYDINWNSSAQIQEVLYDKEKLPVLKRSKNTGNPSADAKTMKRLAAKGYEIPNIILDYKSTNTMIKMFLNRWEEDSSYDGRIHPSFGLTNVRTGRTSCSNPNLQQVPRLTEIRSMYRPKKGRILLEADYKQLELVIAAHYSKDPTMIAIYKRGGDIHMETAASLVAGKEVTKSDRNKAKAVNFGFVYKMGARGFVDYAFDSYGQVFSLTEAEHYRNMFYAKYSRLLPWHDEMEALCESMGGVSNLFGRFRALPDIYSNNMSLHNAAWRRAVNTPVQSTGSDLLVSAATQLNHEWRHENVDICCTVHDSLLAEADEGDEEWVMEQIKTVMRHPKVLDDFNITLRVPLDVDIGVGPWGTH